MDIEQIVLYYLIEVVKNIQDGIFEINNIEDTMYHEVWESLSENSRRKIGKMFKEKVDTGHVAGVSYHGTLSNHHSQYNKNRR